MFEKTTRPSDKLTGDRFAYERRHNHIVIAPVRADDFNIRVILYNSQYHTHALISEFVKEKIGKHPRVIAGEPEATLHVNNNKITSVF